MKLVKKKTYPMEKCYAITPLEYNGSRHIVVAAEKTDACVLFDEEGNYEDTIWTEPGGTMSLVQWPLSNGVFLASQRMYSPNDSKDAEIVMVSPNSNGGWSVNTLVKIPFVHRFDVLTVGTKRYLLASTIKSGHKYKEDWSSPGQVLVAELPFEITADVTLDFTIIKDGLLKNHGYCRMKDSDGDYSVISAENGVYSVKPPTSRKPDWEVKLLLKEPISDIAFVDFDGDGKDEMITLSPFHGDTIRIHHENENGYEVIYEYPYKVGFVHSLWAGIMEGKPYAIIGHRKGDSRDLLGFSYHEGTFKVDILDKDVGSTNVLHYECRGQHRLVSTNREINEIAFYDIEV
jgi:hypothetical protein